MRSHAKGTSVKSNPDSGRGRLWSLLAIAALALCALGSGASSASAAPATATMGPIEDVSYASAHLTGEVGPTDPGHETYYYFQYSTDGVNWSYGPHAFDPGRSVLGGTATSTPVSEDLTDLKGGTEYFARLQTVDSVDFTEVFSPEPYPSFTTLPVDPPAFVSADEASEVAYTTAKATGKVERPSGNSDPAFDVKCRFEYVSDQQFDESGFEFPAVADCAQNPIEDDGVEKAVSAELGGLTFNTTYHLRLSAENAGGTISDDAPATFTTLTPSPPAVEIDPVTIFTDSTAHFSGTVNPGGSDPALEANWEFVCTPGCEGAGSAGTIAPDNAPHTVEFDPSGLEANTDYEVKLIVTNQGGSNNDQASFKTTPARPLAQTLPAFALGNGTEALLGGKVNPRNSATKYWIEYGPGPGGPGASYPNSMPASKDAVVPSQVSLTGDLVAGLPQEKSKRVSNVLAPSGALAVDQRISGPGIPPQTTITKIAPGAIAISKDASATAQGVSMTAAGIQVLTQKISGLSPASTYHFRIVAENGSGTSEGEDVSFETLPVPEPPPASCANEKLRSETNSEALPECRAYEMTSAPLKNGGDTSVVVGASVDGNRVGYYSGVGFPNPDQHSNTALNDYLAQRTASGWTTRSIQPKFEVPSLASTGIIYAGDFTADYSKTLTISRGAAASEPNVMNVFSTDLEGATTWITRPTLDSIPLDDKAYTGHSADGSHVVFDSGQSFKDGVSGTQVWEWVNGDVRLVSILPDGSVPPNARTGDGSDRSLTTGTNFLGTLKTQTSISEDGSRIFFASGDERIFVREDGEKTREIDLSRRAGSVGQPPITGNRTHFVGAASDGSVAFFVTDEQLTDDAPPGGGYYAYDLESDELRFITASAAQPGGVALISRDGSHFYFATSAPVLPGKGSPGAPNLYVADQDGVKFIATLNPDDGQDWDPGFGNGGKPTVAASADGEHFLFQSYERLTSFDNAGRNEIYRYEAADGSITCVSCGLQDRVAAGDASMIANPLVREQPAVISQLGRTRVMADDGRILFQTTDALLSSDVNGLSDVYLYDHGSLNLISTGTSKYPSEVGDITPDGKNAFFITRDSLVGQDIDGGAIDAYDARVEGGFPAPPLPNPCASESTCQGAPRAAPGFTSPPTLQPGRGNKQAKGPQKKCKGKAKRKHAKCGSKKGKHHPKKQGKRTFKNGRGQ